MLVIDLILCFRIVVQNREQGSMELVKLAFYDLLRSPLQPGIYDRENVLPRIQLRERYSATAGIYYITW